VSDRAIRGATSRHCREASAVLHLQLILPVQASDGSERILRRNHCIVPNHGPPRKAHCRESGQERSKDGAPHRRYHIFGGEEYDITSNRYKGVIRAPVDFRHCHSRRGALIIPSSDELG
jgi:hypothetical protein